MHLDGRGEIIPDSPEENLFLAEAHVAGINPSHYYPGISGVSRDDRDRLVAHLEDGERTGASAAVRGLARMAASQGKHRATSIEWLTQLAEHAIANPTQTS